MLNNTIFHIIYREFITRARKKSFIILTILLPVLVGIMLLASILIAINATEEMNIAVKDETRLFEDKIRGLDNGKLSFHYIRDNQNIEHWKENYEKKYDALLYIPILDLDKPNGITYYSNKQLGYQTESIINKAITEEIRNRVLIREKYDVELIDKLAKEISIEKVIKDKTQYGRSSLAGGIGYIAGFLIYMFLFVYGAMVMKGVSEEKQNRIVEVLITIVKPFDLMLGKILGIGLLGLFQFLIWGILIFGIQTLIGIFFAEDMQQIETIQSSSNFENANLGTQVLTDISLALKDLDIARILFSFLFYFLFGYIFYAAQFAAIGSAVTDDTDTQSFTFPITIPIIISLVLMSIAIEQPFSAAAKWGSMLPFSSPIIMPARIPFNVSWLEQLASMFILVAASIIMIWLSARIYKVGILVQGKKVNFKEIIQWIFAKI
jgi:ABC-2 type transport system permease protein